MDPRPGGGRPAPALTGAATGGAGADGPATSPGPFSSTPDLRTTSPDGARLALFRVRPRDETGASASSGETRIDRPALLLVHGATADHTTWRAVGPAFAASRPTFAIDRRGRGASGDAETYAIEREFEDIAAAADAIGRATGTKVDVVGHSYGGRVALGASLLTDSICRLVVYEGAPVPPGMSYRPPGLVEAVRAALERGDNEGALTTFLAGIVGMSDAALAAYRADPVWPVRVAAAPTILREIEAEATPAAGLDALGRVRIPVLLILGSISRSPFRIGTDELARRLRDVRVATIAGAAHAAHHTHAPEFVRLVEDFLDRHD
ncbi:MAG TPA: alpha/beta hydrolase [Candidatus Binatia bacterium]|nr:alpha/beta hydrolase [Candidatus Binatia bacterium]